MGEMQLVVFRLDSEEYGIDIGRVREIVRVKDIVRIPGAADYIEGMVNLRGHIVPVVDIKRKFFSGGTSVSAEDKDVKDGHKRMIVVVIDDSDVGVLVSSVTEILRVTENDIERAPTVVRSAESDNSISGIAKVGERLIVVLDLDEVFSGEMSPETLVSRTKMDSIPRESEKSNAEGQPKESLERPSPAPENGKDIEKKETKTLPDDGNDKEKTAPKKTAVKLSEKSTDGEKKGRTVRVKSFAKES